MHLKTARAKDWQKWHHYFQQNARHPYRYRFTPFIPDRAWWGIARTLERFRQSEIGEGRIVKDLQKVKLPFLDQTYYQSLQLFVSEEGRHARVLAGILDACGYPPSGPAGGVSLFRFVRGLFGPCFKLSILLGAEINACVFYKLLTQKIKEHEVHYNLCRIISDENEHLNFHLDFFHRFKSYSPVRFFIYTRLLKYVVAPAAFMGVWLTNLSTWRLLHVGFIDSYRYYRICKKVTLSRLL